MVNLLITDNNLKTFIESLKIAPEQKNFLLDELPKMNAKERLELLETLKDIFLLNAEENEALEKIKNNWQK